MVALPATFALEPRYKEQFAQFLDEGFSAFLAALRLWPNDTGLALKISETWPNDEYVIAVRAKRKADVEAKDKPPSKDAQVKRIEARMAGMDDEDYLKAERLIADLLGHVEKPGNNVNIQQNTFERVMVVRDHGGDDAWEDKLKAQQAKLVEGSHA